MSSGKAKSFDHCHLVHGMWAQALSRRMNLWVERVASNMNVADMPSRKHYCVLNALKAKYRAPVFSSVYYEPASWKTLKSHV